MILVARNVAEAIAELARRYEATEEHAAARTLPGYDAWDRAIQAQYGFPSSGTSDHGEGRLAFRAAPRPDGT